MVCRFDENLISFIIIIIIGSLPWGRFLAPTSSTSLYPLPSSSFPHIHHSFLSFPYSDYSLNHFPRPFSYQMLLLGHLSGATRSKFREGQKNVGRGKKISGGAKFFLKRQN